MVRATMPRPGRAARLTRVKKPGFANEIPVVSKSGGAGQNRTDDTAFAEPGLTTWRPRRLDDGRRNAGRPVAFKKIYRAGKGGVGSRQRGIGGGPIAALAGVEPSSPTPTLIPRRLFLPLARRLPGSHHLPPPTQHLSHVPPPTTSSSSAPAPAVSVAAIKGKQFGLKVPSTSRKGRHARRPPALNVGCIPRKPSSTPRNFFHAAHAGAGHGIVGGDKLTPSTSGTMMRNKAEVVNRLLAPA